MTIPETVATTLKQDAQTAVLTTLATAAKQDTQTALLTTIAANGGGGGGAAGATQSFRVSAGAGTLNAVIGVLHQACPSPWASSSPRPRTACKSPCGTKPAPPSRAAPSPSARGAAA